MTIYFHNFVNQACSAASYVRDTARAHPTAAKVAALSIAIFSSYAIAKCISGEVPSPPGPNFPTNASPILQPQMPPVPKTDWEKIKDNFHRLPSDFSGFCKRYWQHATSIEENWESFKHSCNRWYNKLVFDAVKTEITNFFG